jgi:hypothetical protein
VSGAENSSLCIGYGELRVREVYISEHAMMKHMLMLIICPDYLRGIKRCSMLESILYRDYLRGIMRQAGALP